MVYSNLICAQRSIEFKKLYHHKEVPLRVPTVHLSSMARKYLHSIHYRQNECRRLHDQKKSSEFKATHLTEFQNKNKERKIYLRFILNFTLLYYDYRVETTTKA